MPRPLTLASRLDVSDLTPPPLPEGWHLRPCGERDADELGAVYFGAYEPGKASASLEEAIDDVRAAFRGEYGDLWGAASPVAEFDGRIRAAVMTVRRSPWPDVPDCPFVIEVFTSPGHRRRGLARHLLIRSMQTTRAAGATTVALRVMSDNRPALGLYGSLGFRTWNDPAG